MITISEDQVSHHFLTFGPNNVYGIKFVIKCEAKEKSRMYAFFNNFPTNVFHKKARLRIFGRGIILRDSVQDVKLFLRASRLGIERKKLLALKKRFQHKDCVVIHNIDKSHKDCIVVSIWDIRLNPRFPVC